MTPEVREETTLTTADIANPAVRYQLDHPPADEIGEVDGARTDVRSADGAQINGARTLTPEQTVVTNDRPGALFPENELNDLRGRWDSGTRGGSRF